MDNRRNFLKRVLPYVAALCWPVWPLAQAAKPLP